MKKTLKIALGIFCSFSIIISLFYSTKENPRVYLNNRVNLAYVNEEISHKDFDNVLNLLKAADFEVGNNIKNSLKLVKGIYIVSDSSFISDKKTVVGIIDFGYIYPILKLKLDTYFDKVDDMYSLKEYFRRKYLNNSSFYLKVEKGNFIVAKRQKDIEKILKSEKYFNQNLLKILDREKENNLGMLILNLGKNPLGGFNELVLTGDVNENDEVAFATNIGGKNDIIKSFNQIEKDGLDGERSLEKNKLYLRSSKDTELRSFLFFLNYFFKNSLMEKISSRISINSSKDNLELKDIPKSDIININIAKKEFIYGWLDIIIKNKFIGKIELKGIAKDRSLKISTIVDEKTAINLLKTAK
ncbi:MAG: hypothetical protein ACRC4S_05500 [Cetobacterium sp.]